MKIQHLLVALFAVLFGAALFGQAQMVSAKSISIVLERPITRPISYFKLSGQVRLLKPKTRADRLPLFRIEIRNVEHNIATIVTTNARGEYGMSLMNGKYEVRVLPFPGYRFVPAKRDVNLVRDVKNVNFVGQPSR